MNLLKILTVSSLVSIIPGQLIRFSFFSSGALNLTDILTIGTSILFLIYSLGFRKSLKLPSSLMIPFSLFSLSATASTVLALNTLSFSQILISSLFLIRFVSYFFMAIVVFNMVSKNQVNGWLNIIIAVGIIFAAIGLMQFFIFPNLTNFAAYGWDPHSSRVFATTLDPNFTGGILSIFFALSISQFLYKKKLIYLILAAFFFSVLILTFSRSSYLSFLTILIIVGFLKSKRVLITALFLFALSFLLITQVRTRIIGAFTLDETSLSRVESWRRAAVIFKDNPLFGVGFNTYRFAQSNYGFFSTDEPLGGHSGSGTDSSLLLVAATTGILGLVFYGWLILALFKLFLKNLKRNYLKLAGFSALSGLIIHSQFVNSLFFPQIMIIFWVIVGLALVYDS